MSLVLNLAQHAKAAILSTSDARKVNRSPHGLTPGFCFSMESRKCCEDDPACRMEELTKHTKHRLPPEPLTLLKTIHLAHGTAILQSPQGPSSDAPDTHPSLCHC